MIDLTNKLLALETTKNMLGESLKNKGIEVLPEDSFRSYSSKIDSIVKGGNAELIFSGNNKVIESIKIDLSQLHLKGDLRNLLNATGEVAPRFHELNCVGLVTKDVTQKPEIGNWYCGEAEANFSNWDISNCTNVHQNYLLKNNYDIKSLIVDNWVLPKRNSIYIATKSNVEKVSIKNWNLDDIVGISFNNCKSLKTIDYSGCIERTGWPTKYISFYGCLLKNVTWPDEIGKDYTGETSTFDMTTYGKNLTKESLIDMINKLASTTRNFSIKITVSQYDMLTPEEIAVAQNKGWSIIK